MSTSAPDRWGRDRTAQDRAGARYWSIEDIRLECAISLSSAWRLVRREGFPAPVVLGPKLIRWRRTEVIRFIDGLEAPDRYDATREAAVAGTSPTYTARAVRRT